MIYMYYEVIDIFILIEEVINKVICRECGVVIIFIGIVREFMKGWRIFCLEYVVYKIMVEK